MARWASEQMLDGSLDIIANNANLMAATEGQPLALSEVTNAKGTLDGKRISAEVTMTTPGDYPKSTGGANERRIDVAAKSNQDVETGVTGNPDHVALYSATVLYYVTVITSPPTGVDDQDKLNFGSWRITLNQPTA